GSGFSLRSSKYKPPTSALGHKRTLTRLHSMSALPPKADIETQSRDVRFVPKADIGTHLDDQASTRLIEPRKSILPTSTPLWRRMAYAIAMWKKVLGIVICNR